MGIPIVNVQPRPSLGESFGQGISGGLAQLIGDYRQNKQTRQALQGLAPLFEQAGLSPEQVTEVTKSGLDPKLATLALREVQKRQAKTQESEQTQRIGQESFNRMAELLKEGNLGLGSKAKSAVFGGKTAESVGEFESLSGALEAMLVDKVSRGTLSNARFKYITETLLPKPTDREATIRGKLKALSRELELDPSVLSKEKKPVAKMTLEEIFK